MQKVLYLIFNEGYSASFGDSLIRRELCAEAIRLATLLELMPHNPENMALLAVYCCTIRAAMLAPPVTAN